MARSLQTDEKFLLYRLREGDHLAFEELYDRYSSQLTANLFKLLKSEELVEEILQDLFLKIWETRGRVDPEQSFRSYLFRIAQNMVYYTFRESARQKRLEQFLISSSSELYSHIEENIVGTENQQQLYDAINQLPPQRCRVFILFKLEGKSYKEISEELGISRSTINDHIQKANQFLRDKINPSALSALLFTEALLYNI